MNTVLGDALQKIIERNDYFRGPGVRVSGVSNHKEWLHFCCATPELDLIVNLSLMQERQHATPRLLCAVRSNGTGWDGDVDEYAVDALTVSRRGCCIGLGDNVRIDLSRGRYHVQFQLRRRPIRIDLELEPRTIPSSANNIDLGAGSGLHWFVVPHLAASGVVTVGAVQHRLREAPAYHDHNWGSFGWGYDYAWIWGYGHGRCAESGATWTMVFDRLMNKARTQDRVINLLLWRGMRQERAFGSRELQVSQRGFLRLSAFKLPRVASMLRPEHCSDVPERLSIAARAGSDELELCFEPDALCQIITPNDSDLGTTLIQEACGQLRMKGSVRGETIDIETRSTFEFLHG